VLPAILQRIWCWLCGAAVQADVKPSYPSGVPRNVDPLTDHARLLEQCRSDLASNNLVRARDTLEALMSREPNDSAVLLMLAMVHAQCGEFAESHAKIEQTLRTNPRNAQAFDAQGNLLRLEGRLEQAIASYDLGLEIDTALACAWSNRALCLQDLGRFAESRASFERAIQLDPDNLTAATNLAALLFDLGDYAQATSLIARVLRTAPEFAQAHVVNAMGLLRHGDYASGWQAYEWRDRRASHPSTHDDYPYPEWDGKPLSEGHLLVSGEQGLGDQIMFASCIEDLLAVAPRCIIECDPRLKPLLARSFPDVHVYAQRVTAIQPWLADKAVPSARTWIGSLPLRFRRSLNEFPRRKSYLVADSSKHSAWTQALAALGSGLKVGISWRGGIATTRRATRSIDLVKWLPILRTQGVHFINLQYGDSKRGVASASAVSGTAIHHWDAAIENYDETAALVAATDLIISVQTSLVHLAGALGKPTWVLVPRNAEWRYGETLDVMPWYASVRLFRQPMDEDWDVVIERVAAELTKISCGPSG